VSGCFFLNTVYVCHLVEKYVGELHKQDQAVGQGVYAVPTGAHVKDSEQVTSAFLMCFCRHHCHMLMVCRSKLKTGHRAV